MEIELHRDPKGITVRLGDTVLTAEEVAALEVSRADWSGLVRIGEFDFDAASLESLKQWTAAAGAGGAVGERLARDPQPDDEEAR